jgi:hypothetical protein
MVDEDNTKFKEQVMSLVARLELVNDFDGAKLVKYLHRRLLNTREWYGGRYDRLRQWANAELNEKQRIRFFCIVANGTADVNESEPLTYAQRIKLMRWRMEKAEAELAALKATGAGRATGVKQVDGISKSV